MYRLLLATLLVVVFAAAQEAQPLSGDVKWMWGMAKNNILRSAEKVPAEHFSFKPSDDVRTMGQLFAHIANANYGICAAAMGKEAPVKGVEKTKTTHPDIVEALKASFTFCDEAYNSLDEKTGMETVKFFGGQRSRAGVLMFNVMHDYEHYGNLVTYMRMKGIVPPSSEPRK